MSRDDVFEDDVEATVEYPTQRRRSYFGRILHFGYTSDGRLINVVTDDSERYVHTVIDVNKRVRKRRARK
jgi:hypothetical protein